MIKKMLLSTLILTLITINLILWPYLYKQAKEPDEMVVNPSVEISNEDGVDNESSSPKEEVIEEKVEDQSDHDVKEDEAVDSNEDAKTFRVVDIK